MPPGSDFMCNRSGDTKDLKLKLGQALRTGDAGLYTSLTKHLGPLYKAEFFEFFE
jgi:hypothetical protein